jgi:hypothetical protein
MQFLAVCIRNSEHLVLLGKGLIEIGHAFHLMEGADLSSWTFDFTTRKLSLIDLYKADMGWGHRIKFTHRSAYDFLFGHSTQSSGHSPWVLRGDDLDRLARLTLAGVNRILRYSPMVFTGTCDLVYPDLIATISAFGLVQSIGSGGKIDVLAWVDEIYRDIGIWYPSERRSIASSNFGMARTDPSWSVELAFWNSALAQIDGYLESRWDVLARHPHARAICSGMLRSYEFNGLERATCARLLAFLNETSTGTATNALNHIASNEWCPHKICTQVSWDASSVMDECHVAADLMATAIDAMERPKQQVLDDLTDLFALLQRQKSFIGRLRLSSGSCERLVLHIQVPLQIAWNGLRVSGSAVEGLSYPTHFRLLCLVNRGEIPRGCWASCTEDVVGQYNLELESLGALFESRIAGDHGYSEFFLLLSPTFVGTQAHFESCLEELKQELRINRKCQLDALQQLCMLAYVKTGFKRFWTIITPETHELAQIGL